jgi:hypothetical protein
MRRNSFKSSLFRIYNKIGLSTPPTGSLLYKFNDVLKKVVSDKPSKKMLTRRDLKQKNMFRVFILDGIGDALWSLTLLPSVFEEFQVTGVELVLPEIESARKGRSEEFLLRFPYVTSISYVKTPIHKANAWDKEGGLNYVHNIGPSNTGLFEYSLVANPYLERGLGYHEIAALCGFKKDKVALNPMDQFVEKEEDSKIFDLLLNNEKFCLVYMGSEADNSVTGLNRGGLLSRADWAVILEEIGKSGITVVLTGAMYDISFSHQVIKLVSPEVRIVNLMGITSLPELIYVQKRANFTLGLASGVTIMAPYLNTDAAIFFRDEEFPMSQYFPYSRFLKGFATDWLPLTYSHRYLPLWYGTDNAVSVVRKLRESGILM